MDKRKMGNIDNSPPYVLSFEVDNCFGYRNYNDICLFL